MDQLIGAFAKINLESLQKPPKPFNLSHKDKQFLARIKNLINVTDRYKQFTDEVLDVIDLEDIYQGIAKREQEQEKQEQKGNKTHLYGYQDLMVLELLDYFRNRFFTWITKPQCEVCTNTDNIESVGIKPPPQPNPDEITRIEVYKCTRCNRGVEFPRIENPVTLLSTRKGRCGEWVNCFMLILTALIGSETEIRYVWNHEDHVWCEYYSLTLKKWVHLDPCDLAFDDPGLYCNNWGKKMSWCIGFNDGYIIDLTKKYVTEDKKIDRRLITPNVNAVKAAIVHIAHNKMVSYYHRLGRDNKIWYHECLLKYNQELYTMYKPEKVPEAKLELKGRQSGGEEWTKHRGESGK